MAKPHELSYTLTARWLFPVVGPPLERGLVAIRGERIEVVGQRGTRMPGVDLGNVAIVPGLVNAHTHLDLSGARNKTAPCLPFTSWLRRVIDYRRSRSAGETQTDIGTGLTEVTRAGTTLLADIATDGASLRYLRDAPIRSIAFHEMIGLNRDK